MLQYTAFTGIYTVNITSTGVRVAIYNTTIYILMSIDYFILTANTKKVASGWLTLEILIIGDIFMYRFDYAETYNTW